MKSHKVKSLCVGIDKGKNDATAWARFLKENGSDVILLVDEDATLKNVNSTFQEILASAVAGGTGVNFIYSGGGKSIVRDHDWRNCEIEDCLECQALVDNGLIWYCDKCHQPGNADPNSPDDGKTQLCDGCFRDDK